MENQDAPEVIKLQWAKGDKFGTVETVASKDDEWTYFESGGRINSGLITEFMVDVSNGQPLDLQIETKNPPKNLNKESVKSPVISLLNSSKKLEEQELTINIQVNIPKPELFNILYDSFEEAAVEDLIKFVKSQYDQNTIDKAISNSIYKHFKINQ